MGSEMMKKLLLLSLLLSPLVSLAQNTRYDNYAQGAPLASVQWCSDPAVLGSNGACTNLATTYNSNGVACPSSSQDTVRAQQTVCQSGTDIFGNIGIWAAPGTYDWTACGGPLLGNSCIGPFKVTLGGSGGTTSAQVAPNQNAFYLSTNCGTQANCFTVKADVQFVSDAAWSNSGTTVTTGSSDPVFTSADVGKIEYGTSNCNGGNGYTTCTLQVP